MDILAGNKKINIEVKKENGNFTGTLDNLPLKYSGKLLLDNTIEIISEGNRWVVFAAEDDNRIYVNTAGKNFTLEKVKEEERSFEGASGKSSDKDLIKAPMPGSIVKVIAELNQQVSEGEPMIIIEAMKMEMTLYASINGIVKEVNAVAGEQVDTDKTLILIEKE